MVQERLNNWTDIRSQLILIFASVSVFCLFGYTAYHRLFYPYDLEWMEGGMLIHAMRVRDGQALYVEPSTDFIPYIYPPLYAWILGFWAKCTTLDYWMGRSISICATMATCVATGLILRDAFRRVLPSNIICRGWVFAGVALFVLGYEDTGTFYDLLRADMLMMALLSWALLCVSRKHIRIAGLLLAGAFWAKHNAAIFGLPCVFWLWATQDDNRAGLIMAIRFALWSAIPALSMVLYTQSSTDGYFLQYLLGVPSSHPIVGSRLFWGSMLEMFGSLGWVGALVYLQIGHTLWNRYKQGSGRIPLVLWAICGLSTLALYNTPTTMLPMLWGSRKHGVVPFAVGIWALSGLTTILVILNQYRQKQNLGSVLRDIGSDLWRQVAVVAVLFSALMRGHHGGFTNVLIPGVWALSVVWIISVHRFAQQSRGATLFACLLLCVQMVVGVWNPEQFIPTQDDKDAGDALVELLAKEEGQVFVPHSPWLSVQSGHSPSTHLIALWDIDHEGGVLYDDVKRIKQDIASQRFSMIVSADRQIDFGIPQYYVYQRSVRAEGNVFLPKIGWKVKPSYVFVPKQTLD